MNTLKQVMDMSINAGKTFCWVCFGIGITSIGVGIANYIEVRKRDARDEDKRVRDLQKEQKDYERYSIQEDMKHQSIIMEEKLKQAKLNKEMLDLGLR